MEDYGSPFEIMSDTSGLKKSQKFLSDHRLHRWYSQNYDLVVCNPTTEIYSDATLKEEKLYVSKVHPIPVGNIDLSLLFYLRR